MVYRGGLENRFGLTANGGSNPSLSASLRSERSDKRRLPRRSETQAGQVETKFDSATGPKPGKPEK